MKLTSEQQTVIAQIAEKHAQQFYNDRESLAHIPLETYIRDAIRAALDALEKVKSGYNRVHEQQ